MALLYLAEKPTKHCIPSRAVPSRRIVAAKHGKPFGVLVTPRGLRSADPTVQGLLGILPDQVACEIREGIAVISKTKRSDQLYGRSSSPIAPKFDSQNGVLNLLSSAARRTPRTTP